jgi:hypothetical protein
MKHNWYYTLNDYCNLLADIYNINVLKVSGILSALSPNNTFKTNIKSLELFLKYNGNCKVSTFNNQKNKALKILQLNDDTVSSDEIEALLGGKKTQDFFYCIAYPNTSDRVVVDIWQERWAKLNNIIPSVGVLTEKRYNIIGDHVRSLASELNIKPHQMQAKIWVDIRGKEF